MKRARFYQAFTLIELILVIGIIGLLMTLAMPAMQHMIQRADSAACFGNLRQIGVAVSTYVIDHDNTYPYIESDPQTMQIYSQLGITAKSMLETFQPYGLGSKNLQCPSDVKSPGPNYFAQKQSSYEWRPMVDGETTTNIEVVRWRGVVHVSPSHLRQVTDFSPVHFGHQNALYADGHVKWYQD